MTVEPIREKKKIDALLMYLKGKNERDYILAKFQLNTGLRISDVIPVQVSDIFTESGNFRSYFILNEKKTGKEKKIKLNNELKKSIKEYISNEGLIYEDYLFKSRKKTERVHITTTQAYRVLKGAAQSRA